MNPPPGAARAQKHLAQEPRWLLPNSLPKYASGILGVFSSFHCPSMTPSNLPGSLRLPPPKPVRAIRLLPYLFLFISLNVCNKSRLYTLAPELVMVSPDRASNPSLRGRSPDRVRPR